MDLLNKKIKSNKNSRNSKKSKKELKSKEKNLKNSKKNNKYFSSLNDRNGKVKAALNDIDSIFFIN